MSGGPQTREAVSVQPYEKIVRLPLAMAKPVIDCHGFQGGDRLSPPLPKTQNLFLRSVRITRTERPTLENWQFEPYLDRVVNLGKALVKTADESESNRRRVRN